ncbi:MAG: hypothetical protein AAF645_19020, partial [Myxococcota bacterium]
ARGVPFRDAHHVAGRLVGEAAKGGRVLADLSLEEFRLAHGAFDETIYDALKMETAVERRDLPGGPARARVEGAARNLRERLGGRGVDIRQLTVDVPA